MEWLKHILFWHWWILAGVLLILELTSPVFVFLWLGFAAAAVGFLLLVFPSIPASPWWRYSPGAATVKSTRLNRINRC